MAENKVVNLQYPNADFEELSDDEMESIVGGTDIVPIINAASQAIQGTSNTLLPAGLPGTVATLFPGGVPGTLGTV
ncbi:bacteriocin [Nostoc sp. UHCC 0302]|uniref:bacteriocin n=1 Tax=Nostoc sp. UHCC 0302 TaxID=3134896 RepID=UPI00311C91A9